MSTKQQFKDKQEFRRRAIHVAYEIIDDLAIRLSTVSTMIIAGERQDAEDLVRQSTEQLMGLLQRSSYTSSALRRLCAKPTEVLDYSHPMRVELAWQQQYKVYRVVRRWVGEVTRWLIYPILTPARWVRRKVRLTLRGRWIRSLKAAPEQEVPDGKE